MTMLKKLPEEVLNLWNNWEIRGMVLLSLLLQTILIIFGSWRKTNGRSWIRILVWSAYLSADVVATVALGNLARSQGDSSGDGSEKSNNSIQAFWAPFLLLHLGGPDTITAYSIEDNELWLRHLLGLVVQVIVAFYVFSRSWGSGILTFIAIPMFVVGIAKYAERTWVLWSSCSKSLKNSSLSDFWGSYNRSRISETPPQVLQKNYLLQAYVFSYISKFMMQDLVPGILSLIRSRELISRNEADGAFKVVEAELGLIYDMLYTKAPLIYSRAGIILRCINSLLSVTAFITFQVKIDKHDYSTTDIAITYLLFAAAVFLEFYAFLCLVFSDWTMIWLIDKGGNGLTNCATYSQLSKLTRSKRWSRSISRYNLISYSFESEPPKCLELLGIDEMMREMHVNRKDLNGELQDLIFKHLREKAEKIKEDLNVFDKNHRSKIVGQRGDGVLEREGLLRDYKWCTTEVEFSRSILVWHLATDICYLVDMKEADAYLNKDGSNASTEDGRCLSEYMMYLLVIRPNMLSKGFGDEGYQSTLRDLRGLKYPSHNEKEYQHTLRELWGPKNHGSDDEGYQRTLRELRNSESRGYGDEQFQRSWKTSKSVLSGVERLVRQLLLLGPEERWEIVKEVWVEMVAYAAAHCPWKEHTQELRRGGELLTHVSLLMLHLGLSEQYEYNVNIGPIGLLKAEEYEEYRKAERKYVHGIGARSVYEDLVLGIPTLIKSQELISKNKAEDAFKMVEIELGLIYDMLYTKAPLVYSCAGIILRFISSLLTFTAFITFQILIDKHAYSTIDIIITYLLFVAAIFLEFYAFLCLVFSDWTIIWLEDEGWNAQNSAIYSQIKTLTRSEKWSRSIAQHDLISSCIENRPLGCLKSLGINEKMRQMFVHRVDMNGDLQRFIFRHLGDKTKKMKEDFCLIDKNLRSKIIGQRGDGVLEREKLLQNYKLCTTEVEFSQSILVWHLATEICYSY